MMIYFKRILLEKENAETEVGIKRDISRQDTHTHIHTHTHTHTETETERQRQTGYIYRK